MEHATSLLYDLDGFRIAAVTVNPAGHPGTDARVRAGAGLTGLRDGDRPGALNRPTCTYRARWGW